MRENTTDPRHPQSIGAAAGSAGERIRMCVIVTVDLTIQNLCRGRLEYLMDRGFDVTVVCAPTSMAADIEARGLRLHTAPLARAITPARDLKALWNLYRFLRRERFDLIEVSTPKAALIGSLAARLTGASCVVHLLRGLVYQQQGRFSAWLARLAQTVACRLSHRVISISASMLEQARRDGVCPGDRGVVLGYGSSNGVDLERFSPRTRADRQKVRRRYGIPDNAMVTGFVGRMTGDKGIVELVDAFTTLSDALPNLYLFLVGDYEERDRPPRRVVETVARHQRIKSVGWQWDTPPLFGAMDFFVLPTYREGFGTVLLEAAAMQLPLITTKATGWWDASKGNETALLVPIRDTAKLKQAMATLAADAELRSRMGAAGRRRVERFYDCRTVWSLQEQEFRRILGRG